MGVKYFFHRKALSLWKYRYLYMMLIPALVAMFIFCYIPMSGLVLAFKDLQYRKGIWGSPWIGFTHFKIFFNDPQCVRLIINTFTISSMKLILAFPFPVMLAIMINEVKNVPFRKISQTVSYLPHFIAWVVVDGIIDRILAPNSGLVNQLVGFLGGDPSTFYMMHKEYFYPVMFISYVWKEIGWNSIIFFAAISTIDPTLYEAAKIDGANKWHEITRITIPTIKPTMGIVFILSLGKMLRTGFDQVYLLRTPGNMAYAEILDTYVIRTGLEQGNFGYATAIGLIQGLAGLILVTAFNKLGAKYTEVSIW